MKVPSEALIVLMASSSLFFRAAFSFMPSASRYIVSSSIPKTSTSTFTQSTKFTPKNNNNNNIISKRVLFTTHVSQLKSTPVDEQTSISESSEASKSSGPTYDFKGIEKKWQDYWDKEETFKTPIRNPNKEKKYVLDMFPYPSGAGLHVGHPEGYTGTNWKTKYLFI